VAYSLSFQLTGQKTIERKPKQTLPERVASAKEFWEELDAGDPISDVFPNHAHSGCVDIIVRKPDTREYGCFSIAEHC
jgi:hypothetical protein